MMRRFVISKVSFVTLPLLVIGISLFAAAQQKPESGDWLLGEWVGIRKQKRLVDATIRITSYDPAARSFKGDGKFVNTERGVTTDLVVEGVIDDKGSVVMTTHHIGGLLPGRIFTFILKRKSNGGLHGTTEYGPPSLSLEKRK